MGRAAWPRLQRGGGWAAATTCTEFDNLVAMLQSTQEELALAIASAPGNEPAVGQMEANFPLETPDGWFADPNDTFYTGDPIALQRRQFRGRP